MLVYRPREDFSKLYICYYYCYHRAVILFAFRRKYIILLLKYIYFFFFFTHFIFYTPYNFKNRHTREPRQTLDLLTGCIILCTLLALVLYRVSQNRNCYYTHTQVIHRNIFWIIVMGNNIFYRIGRGLTIK